MVPALIRPVARFGLAAVLALSLCPPLAFASENSSLVDKLEADTQDAYTLALKTGDAKYLNGVAESVLPAAANAESGPTVNGASVTDPTFDLRYDEKGNLSGLVTPVKSQNPWGTCWSFGAIAASETSILAELALNGYDISDMDLDLSERHLAWFCYTPFILEGNPQSGEGNTALPAADKTDTQRVFNQGGMPFSATSLFSTGVGPALEEEAPYHGFNPSVMKDEAGEDLCYSPKDDWSIPEMFRLGCSYELEESNVLPTPADSEDKGDVGLSYKYNEDATNAIKNELIHGRAVEVAFCADTYKPEQKGDDYKYLNTETWAHYTFRQAQANHAVTIVGWDDGYKKENFFHDGSVFTEKLPKVDALGTPILDENGQVIMEEATVKRTAPEGDGAWIVKNSWGSVKNLDGSATEFPNKFSWGVDGTGYFYLSYYDQSLSAPESFDFRLAELDGPQSMYRLVNQHDYMPATGVVSEAFSEQTSMANVFTAEESQMITELSCETAKPDTAVTFELYLLNEGASKPTDGELVGTWHDAYDYGGYHRFTLPNQVYVPKGTKFSVVVTQTTETEDGALQYHVLMDRAMNEEGVKQMGQYFGMQSYATGIVNKGESWVYGKDTETGEFGWTDFTEVIAALRADSPAQAQGEEGGSGSDGASGGGVSGGVMNVNKLMDFDNFAIKAYANPMEHVPNLVGLTEEEALAELEFNGLLGVAGAPVHSDTVPAGRVVSQDIAENTEVALGTTVTYVLSLGKASGEGPAGPATPPATNQQPGSDNGGNKFGGAFAKTADGAGTWAGAATMGLVLALGCVAFFAKRKR